MPAKPILDWSRINILGSLSDLQTQIWTWGYGEFVGADDYGNQYYTRKGGKSRAHELVDAKLEKTFGKQSPPEPYEDVYGNIISPAEPVKLLASNALTAHKTPTATENTNVNVQKNSLRKERRWVVYKGEPDASKIPPEWHAWMHHTVTKPPAAKNPLRRKWQIPYQPNMTGTDKAYLPEGHTLRGGKRAAATGDYEAWTPEGA